MTLDYVICPHCGCHCEDDEYCAACGKLFREDVVTRNVSLLGSLGGALRSKMKRNSQKKQSHLDIEHESAWTDPAWFSLPGNMFHQD